MHTPSPEERAAVIEGLRALAAHLAANPGIPVPAYGIGIMVTVDDAAYGGTEQVDQIAALMGTPVADPAPGGSYKTSRGFGPVSYTVLALSDDAYEEYEDYKAFRRDRRMRQYQP